MKVMMNMRTQLAMTAVMALAILGCDSPVMWQSAPQNAAPAVTIVEQPKGGVIYFVGDPAAPIEVEAQSGGDALTYQWYQGAEAVPGATGRTYTPLTNKAGSFFYSVEIKNASSKAVKSDNALIIVMATDSAASTGPGSGSRLTVTAVTPGTVECSVGDSVSLMAIATLAGGAQEGVVYQWKRVRVPPQSGVEYEAVPVGASETKLAGTASFCTVLMGEADVGKSYYYYVEASCSGEYAVSASAALVTVKAEDSSAGAEGDEDSGTAWPGGEINYSAYGGVIDMSDTNPKYGSAPENDKSSGTGWTYNTAAQTYTIGAGGTYLVRGSTVKGSENNGNRLAVADYVTATVMLDNVVIDTGGNQHAAITLGDNAVLTVYGVGTVSGISGGSVDLTGAHITVTDIINSAVTLGNSAVLTVNGTVTGGSVTLGNSASLTLAAGGSMTNTAVTLGNNAALTANGAVTSCSVSLGNGAHLTYGAASAVTNSSVTLGDSSALTVNGTLNAAPGNISVASAAATPAVINGSGEISLTGTGNLLTIPANKGLVLDGVTFRGSTSVSNVSLVTVSGELVMQSGAITGHTGQNYNGSGGVKITGGVFTMKGGAVSDNKIVTSHKGAGVYIDGGGTFNLEDGEIKGNTCGSGAGVCLNSGSFNMSGGKIKDNHALASSSSGGGVRMENGTTFLMSGGVIYGKTEAVELANTDVAGGGAAFYKLGGTAQYGNGAAINNSNNTLTGG
ncbi:MAG: hypothetical protein MdMp014T_2996 [Treponematales bacterium]